MAPEHLCTGSYISAGNRQELIEPSVVITLLEQLVGLKALYGQDAVAGLYLGDWLAGLLPGLCSLASPASGLAVLARPACSSVWVACHSHTALVSSPVNANSGFGDVSGCTSTHWPLGAAACLDGCGLWLSLCWLVGDPGRQLLQC